MKILIIRSCDRDLLLAQLCYETAVKHNVADKYIFFHEVNAIDLQPVFDWHFLNNPNFIVIKREYCDNFGGASNIITMLKEIKGKLPVFSDSDDIIFCDSDIIFLKNPFDFLPKECDHAGVYDVKIGGEINHVSGQLNIIKGWLWNLYISEGEFNFKESRKVLDKHNYSIADDSVFSVFAHENKAKQFSFNLNECWLHYKIQPDEFEKYLNL